MAFIIAFREDAVFGMVPGERKMFYSYLGVDGSLVRRMWRKLDSLDVIDLRLFTSEAVEDTERSR